MQPATSVIEGYLKKKSPSRIKSWQLRWFVVRDGLLLYYRTHNDRDQLGLIPLELIKSVHPLMGTKLKGKAFEVDVEERRFQLMAESEAEQRRWLSALESQITQAKRLQHLRRVANGRSDDNLGRGSLRKEQSLVVTGDGAPMEATMLADLVLRAKRSASTAVDDDEPDDAPPRPSSRPMSPIEAHAETHFPERAHLTLKQAGDITGPASGQAGHTPAPPQEEFDLHPDSAFPSFDHADFGLDDSALDACRAFLRMSSNVERKTVPVNPGSNHGQDPEHDESFDWTPEFCVLRGNDTLFLCDQYQTSSPYSTICLERVLELNIEPDEAQIVLQVVGDTSVSNVFLRLPSQARANDWFETLRQAVATCAQRHTLAQRARHLVGGG